MDQTMCRFDMPPKTTNNMRGQQDVRIATAGGTKRGFTVALTAFADGTKLPAFVVFKEPAACIPSRVFAQLVIPVNVVVTATRNGWMTSATMEQWVNRVWGQNTDDH